MPESIIRGRNLGPKQKKIIFGKYKYQWQCSAVSQWQPIWVCLLLIERAIRR